MGTTIYRVTGLCLSFTILALGGTLAALLYVGGDTAIDIFYPADKTYTDADSIIRRRMPTDDWYGTLMLRGWAIGFLPMLPGVSGIVAVLFYVKCTLVLHTLVSILVLVLGSLLYSAGAMGMVGYWVVVHFYAFESYRYSITGDCRLVNDNGLIDYIHEDQRCLEIRKALIYAIAAIAAMFVAWVFVLADLLFRAFTAHNISTKEEHFKTKEQKAESQERYVRTRGPRYWSPDDEPVRRRPRRRLSPSRPAPSSGARRHDDQVRPPVAMATTNTMPSTSAAEQATAEVHLPGNSAGPTTTAPASTPTVAAQQPSVTMTTAVPIVMPPEPSTIYPELTSLQQESETAALTGAQGDDRQIGYINPVVDVDNPDNDVLKMSVLPSAPLLHERDTGASDEPDQENLV